MTLLKIHSLDSRVGPHSHKLKHSISAVCQTGHVEIHRDSCIKTDTQFLLYSVKYNCEENNSSCFFNVYHVSSTVLRILHILFHIFLKTL